MIGSESNGFHGGVVFTKVRLSLVRLFEYGQSCGGAMSAVPDRSEIGPYLGGHWAIFRGFPLIPPHRCTSEVGRFLRKYPRLRCRTARRSIPTQEVIGLYLGGFPLIPPHRCTSEVGRFLQKHPCRQRRTARRSIPTQEVIGLLLLVPLYSL